ncbi:coiled-coil domain-containing protein 200 [Meriones unguiculatus]|uniref:coiled-coil domain-containing protein 200 n=1 Tax=Meriones unguiculatus TaxID=10047 RepID=UPI00293EC2B3|nr:coiled-coil domain-containing protein 200 [Meriones unguiculatus]
MGSAYHWEARRRQMALERRKKLIEQQQEQEIKKLEEKKQHFEKTCIPHQDSKGLPPARPQPQPQPQQPQPQPLPPPPPPPTPGLKSQTEQDTSIQITCKGSLQSNTQRQRPQTRPAGTQQDGQKSCSGRGPPILPGYACTYNYYYHRSSSGDDSLLSL